MKPARYSHGISMPSAFGTPVGWNATSSWPQRALFAKIGTWICSSVERSPASGVQICA